ncbi:MAG: flippase-like domain-containing protein [Acidobacteria bacterium]|nr:flippase-like domain-containing protein [Acidobacteriota bacterium]
MPAIRTRRRFRVVGVAASVVCAALFVWLVWQVGPRTIWAGLRQIGWGLLAIVALAGLRFSARAAAWTICIEPPHRLRFTDAFGGVVAGDALGNITPLGPIVGEPTKAAFVRGRVPLAPALTALAIENVLYMLSTAAMIAAGMIALLLRAELPAQLRGVSEVALAAMLALVAVAVWLLWQRPAVLSRPLTRLIPAALHGRIDSVRALEQEIYTFATRRRAAMVPLAALEVAFHALGVAEVHVTLWMLQGSPPPLLVSFIVESVNRLITVLFKFVPMQVGVNEAGTAVATQVLGLGATPGITLGVVRKVRMLFWTMIGTGLLIRRGLSPRRAVESGVAPDQLGP